MFPLQNREVPPASTTPRQCEIALFEPRSIPALHILSLVNDGTSVTSKATMTRRGLAHSKIPTGSFARNRIDLRIFLGAARTFE